MNRNTKLVIMAAVIVTFSCKQFEQFDFVPSSLLMTELEDLRADSLFVHAYNMLVVLFL